ncbi:MAG: prepilin-type N-terminal cleavage/methylation domain-containing protein [Phycisphaerales bacterium]|nr:prepilin-type N-terminal cleavage/methylation domain-containing protein [Phycisphaerales bacterium]
MRPRNLRAFSLLELILVIALIGVLAVFAWPDFTGGARAERLIESARRFEALVAMCRAEAMNEARRYRIVLVRDGSLRVKAQRDPLYAAADYETVRSGWSQTEILQDEVWVESVQSLPEGPPPIRIVDEKLEFPQLEPDLTPISEFDTPPALDFSPDGACNSMRIVLRDVRGRALLLTVDGRFGRIQTEEWDALEPGEVRRPKPIDEQEKSAELEAEKKAAESARKELSRRRS